MRKTLLATFGALAVVGFGGAGYGIQAKDDNLKKEFGKNPKTVKGHLQKDFKKFMRDQSTIDGMKGIGFAGVAGFAGTVFFPRKKGPKK